MRRKIYDKLLEWKKNHKGDTALLIEGARRIGKSYIVEEFARKEYASYILVDFSKVNPQVMEFFNLYLAEAYSTSNERRRSPFFSHIR